MRRNEKLGVSRRLEIVDDPQERKLPLWRERGLRLIEDVDPLLEPVGEERQEGLTVGLLSSNRVSRFDRVRPFDIGAIPGRCRLYAFRPSQVPTGHESQPRLLTWPGSRRRIAATRAWHSDCYVCEIHRSRTIRS